MSDGTALRVLIVDDEPLARTRIADLLAEEPGVEVVGTASNPDGAVEEIRDLDPDLVFLDVQMPGGTGFDVVQRVGPDDMPATIFVTAFDQHAVSAFEIAAVDYLVKPFDDERFRQALQRAREGIQLRAVSQLAGRLRSVLTGEPAYSSTPAAAAPMPSEQYLERLAVESRGQVRVVPVSAIDYITADGPYVNAHVGKERHVLRERMRHLEKKLNPAQFLRVHRSTIVRLDLVNRLIRHGGGDYELELKDGTRVGVSRTRIAQLEARIGLSR